MSNRLVCEVLEEARTCHKTRNYSYLPGLLEEIQTMVNRMESALSEKRDYEHWHKKVKDEKEEYKKLLEETNKLRQKKGDKNKELSKY